MSKFTFSPKKRKSLVLRYSESQLFFVLSMTSLITLFSSFTINSEPNGEVWEGGCKLRVSAGEDISGCSTDNITLTAAVSGASSCTTCVEYQILDTKQCQLNEAYVFYLAEGNQERWFSNVDLKWNEAADGSATLKGTIYDHTRTEENYTLNVTLTGKTSETPDGSPKEHLCNNENTRKWMYYEGFSGTLTNEDESWSIRFSRRGPAFQMGQGANETEKTKKTYGASGWFISENDVSIQGDVNINFGDCMSQEENPVEYLWSNGATTQNITVYESGIYTVSVKDCETCDASDSVKVQLENSLTVDAGEDQEICGGEVILTATVSGESVCEDCLGYEIFNTTKCKEDENDYVFYLAEGNKTRLFSNVDLQWNEMMDGTATLKGTIFDFTDTQSNYVLDIIYSGRTTETPADSPKNHFCHEENIKGWVYYTGTSGTITSEDGTWSVAFSRRGPAFQLGKDANETEKEKGTYGASGWFIGDDDVSIQGDVNINIGDCIQQANDTIDYLWSTGETTPTITVSDSGTYTVTVSDCSICNASDSVAVIIDNTLVIDAGADQEICRGGEVTLTATVSGDASCEDCVDYTIENATYCELSQKEYVFYLVEGETRRWFSNVDLQWSEAPDGTATLKGTIFDFTETQANYELEATFSGATTEAPVDSPKLHLCHDEDSTNWVYYTGFSGTITSDDNSWSLNFTRRGPAFQIGIGASEIDKQAGRNGGSGWFIDESDVAVTGDLNFNFGSCVNDSAKGIEYLWSTGETAPTITVSEAGTYTVTASGCGACVASDEVVVNFTDGLQVDIGEDQTVCDAEVVLTAAISGAGNCIDCSEFDALNTTRCNGTEEYVMWVSDINGPRWFSNVNLVWSESDDGTAILSGKVADISNPNDVYIVGAIFSGKTTETPMGSPRNHACNDENPAGWEYYTSMFGILSSADGSWSIDISRRGPAFQIGNGANDTEQEAGATGGSGWFIASDDVTFVGDFNFIKGDCIGTESNSNISYLWSTGETTPSITVTESDTYSVVVNGCEGCEGFDDVVVTFDADAISVAAGEDVEVCTSPFPSVPEMAQLTATGGDSYLWSTGETTATIIVYPEAAVQTYTVTAFKGTCSGTDEVVVSLIECNSGDGAQPNSTGLKAVVYPTPQAADQALIMVELNNTIGAKSMISFQLYDINGKVIHKPVSKQMETGRNTIELGIPNLSPGVYLLEMINGANGDQDFSKIVID